MIRLTKTEWRDLLIKRFVDIFPDDAILNIQVITESKIYLTVSWSSGYNKRRFAEFIFSLKQIRLDTTVNDKSITTKLLNCPMCGTQHLFCLTNIANIPTVDPKRCGCGCIYLTGDELRLDYKNVSTPKNAGWRIGEINGINIYGATKNASPHNALEKK